MFSHYPDCAGGSSGNSQFPAAACLSDQTVHWSTFAEFMKITLYPKYFFRSLFVKGKGSFYSAGYSCLYPEVFKTGMTPWQHYVIDGQRKGYDNGNHPSGGLFFPEGYECEYPDVKSSDEDAWHHYAEKGLPDGRDNGLHPKDDQFFPEGYLEMYQDVAESGLDPWHHYVLIGKPEGRDCGLHPADNTCSSLRDTFICILMPQKAGWIPGIITC